MRIIGGKFRKKKIASVKGISTRPTSDRLRETIFNIISTSVMDSVVLDLYAGTGAFGIEALSRGAEFAVFIDNNKTAIDTINSNIQSCNLSDSCEIIFSDILKNLNRIKSKENYFDLVFMDPPYNRNTLNKTFFNLHKSCTLRNNANIIVEHSPDETVQTDIKEFVFKDQRKYGKSVVSFFNYIKNEDLDEDKR